MKFESFFRMPLFRKFPVFKARAACREGSIWPTQSESCETKIGGAPEDG